MILLLDIVIGPYTFRLANVSVDVQSDDGAIRYEAGLVDIAWDRVFRLSADAPANDIPVEILPGALDIPALILAGHDVSSAQAALSRLPSITTSYENRIPLLSGRVSEVEYAEASEPVRFSILAVERNASNLVPSASAILQWSDIPANTLGSIAPLVFGQPGWKFRGVGSFGHAVQNPGVLQGVVICEEPVHAASVWMAYADEKPEDRTWVSHDVLTGPSTADNVPGSQAYVELESSLFLTDPNNAGAVGTRWTRFALRWQAYGVMRPTSRDPVKTAGELIEYLLWRGGNVDRARTAAAVPHLPIVVDGYIDDRVEPVDWLVDNVCSILPVSIVSGPEGMYPVVARPYIDPTLPRPSLSVDRREIYPTGSVVFDAVDDVRNEIQISWELDADTRKYRSISRHTGDTSVTPANEVAVSREAVLSRARYGERPYTIRSNILYRVESAHQVAAWMIRRYALPARSASYVLDYDISDRLLSMVEPGAPVDISDPSRGIEGLCLVERVSTSPDGLHTIDIRTVETA